ncbi:MAG: hypothetical protein AAGI44_13535 [Pseudomonadota bacterium]
MSLAIYSAPSDLQSVGSFFQRAALGIVTMSNDDLDHIPSIVPTREGSPSSAATGANTRRSASSSKRQTKGGGTTGPLGRVLITVSLVVAAIACAWAWQLQQEMAESQQIFLEYDVRIGDLEARLSDTDEGMNQNAEVQAAKIRELDSEVRKLWDNVWKKASARLDALEKNTSSQGAKLDATASGLATAQSQLKGASGDIASLKAVADELDRVIATGRVNQSEVERVADSINRVNLELAKLNKRVQSNEEWIQSINTFRQQVNASILELQAALRARPAPGT